MRKVAVLTAVLAIWASAQTYTIKTFAGGALPENLAGTSACLSTVSGMAVDRGGNVYLALGDYHAVLRLDAATTVLSRVAGTGIAGYSGDNGPATNAQLNNPTALAVDSSGNLYIADTNNGRIRMVSSSGAITTFAGNGTAGYGGDNGPAAGAQFYGLADLALGPSGDLYVADFYNQVIRKISQGVVTTVAGSGTAGFAGDGGSASAAQLNGPAGIAIDSNGILYIADAYNNRIRAVQNGVITTVAGNGTANFSGDKGAATAATLKMPAGVAVDSTGKLYIADFGNNRIRMVAAAIITTIAGTGTATYSGDHVTATTASLVSPQRVATDAAGSLYIGDGPRIRKVANLAITTMAGGGNPAGIGGPAAAAQLLSPQGLAVDSAGALYVADSGTARVLKISSGVLSLVAGGGLATTDNGPATGALLSGPYGVAADSTGVLYIADTVASRVRKVSNGVIATAAGGGTVLGDNGPATSALVRQPQAVAVDSGGNLYIADSNRVRLVSSGTINTVAGNGSAGYQGDSGPATAGMLSDPSSVALDSSGNLYIADSGNNRVRKVAAGTITTAAGNGTYGFTGANGAPTSAAIGSPAAVALDAAGNLYIADAWRILRVSGGKISTIAGLNGAQGLVVDSTGAVYASEPASHRIYVLAPAGTSCAVTIAQQPQTALAAGGSVSIGLQTGAACSWTVESLPQWIAMAANPYGAGPATVTLTASVNNGAPRTATIVVGGQNVTLVQAGSATISGQITLQPGGVLAGATVKLTGAKTATATTDSGGNYAFSGLDSTGSYTVTPSAAGYGFVPTSLAFAAMTSNPTGNFVAWPQPAVGALAPSFVSQLQPVSTTFAAGEIVTVYGTNLCSTAASAAPTLPDRLAACFVQVDGTNIRLYYASATQINAVLPQTLSTGTHQLVVVRYTDTTYKQVAAQSWPLPFQVSRVAMAFVELSATTGASLAAQYLDGGFASQSRPVHAADYVVLYLTGLGKTTGTFAEGAAPKVTAWAVESVQVTVQGKAATVLYAGVQPQYPGLYQITMQVPQYALASGTSTVTIQITAPATGQTLQYFVYAN